MQSLVAHDPLPSTSSPSPALALPFFLRLALKTDLRRFLLPLPLAPSCRGLVILPATALARRPSRPMPEGSNLSLGSASENEFGRVHLFPAESNKAKGTSRSHSSSCANSNSCSCTSRLPTNSIIPSLFDPRCPQGGANFAALIRVVNRDVISISSFKASLAKRKMAIPGRGR